MTMKIRVSICTEDAVYAERLVDYFNAHYYDRFSWNVYTTLDYLLHSFEPSKTDILLLGEELKGRIGSEFVESLGNCQAVYLIDRLDDESDEELYRIEKYHCAEKIYQDLLEIYSQKSSIYYANAALINSNTEIYAFIAPCGGIGTSTVALAAAKRFARTERVLYLNFENISGAGLAFSDKTTKGFKEIIFALKSRRKALDLKIESTVNRDRSGIFYFGDCDNALELGELNDSDVRELLIAIQNSQKYDKVLIDVGNGLQEKDIAVLSLASRLVMVMDNSEVSEIKMRHYLATLQIIEEQKKMDICSKLLVFMNKIHRNVPLPEQYMRIHVKGGLPRMENGTYLGIIERLADIESLQNIR